MRLLAIASLVVLGCHAPSAPAIPTGDGEREGRSIFLAKCGNCHDYPDPAAFGDDQWPGILDRMQKRAGLDPKQKESLLRYVRAARHAK